MSAPAPAPAKAGWAPSPLGFVCAPPCGRRVRRGDLIFWLMGSPQLICRTCAEAVVEQVLDVRELEKLWKDSPGGTG